jgi:uncharacterized membrane protein YgcG
LFTYNRYGLFANNVLSFYSLSGLSNPVYGLRTPSSGPRQSAFNLVVLLWLFCGALLCLLALTVCGDEARVQTQVRLAVLLDRHRRTQQRQRGVGGSGGGGGELNSFCERGVGMELGGAENPLHSQLLKDEDV